MFKYGKRELIGHENIVKVLQNTKFQSTILYGQSGIGKSTLIRMYLDMYLDDMHLTGMSRASVYQEINGTKADTATLRKAIADDKCKIILIDEFQYLTKKQQQLFLEPIETDDLIILATTTENPYQFCHDAILSRCRVLSMYRPTDDEILEYAKSLVPAGAKFEENVLEKLVTDCDGDVRRVINNMLTVLSAANNDYGKCIVTADLYLDVFGRRVNNPSTVESLKSALQKSIRGSHLDASCMYALALLENGELEVLCRRLRVICHEDIGLSDNNVAILVNSCIDDALSLGMPEARYPILHAVSVMAMSKKSNLLGRVMMAYDELDKSKIIPPKNIASEYASGYLYPHDYNDHWVYQRYIPDEIKDNIKLAKPDVFNDEANVDLIAYRSRIDRLLDNYLKDKPF